MRHSDLKAVRMKMLKEWLGEATHPHPPLDNLGKPPEVPIVWMWSWSRRDDDTWEEISHDEWLAKMKASASINGRSWNRWAIPGGDWSGFILWRENE
jgi:hypothetical protein